MARHSSGVETTVAHLSRRQVLRSSLALASLGLLSACGVLPLPAQPPKAARIGMLSAYALDPSPEATAFRAALRDFGYAEGQNLTFLPRYGSGKDAIASRAAELIGLKPDAILVIGDDPARAAKDATNVIPIVMADGSDPVGDGLIASLARPGRNVTGLTSLTTVLHAKRLELLRAAAPGVSSVTVFWVSDTDELPGLRELQAAAEALSVRLSVVRTPDAFHLPSPFTLSSLAGADGVIVVTSSLNRATPEYQRNIADFVNERRLPAVYESRAFVEAGGLLAYGSNVPDLFRRAATYVDKIIKGAKPADLPVEQPTRFDLVVNLKTAQGLGLTMPHSILMQATELIQ